MADTQFNPAAEFRALPLDVIIAQPLVAAVNAQKQSAEATVGFINSMMTGSGTPADPYTPVTVDFTASLQNSNNQGTVLMDIKAPLLSIVPIPNLRIDSLSVSFKYEVSQSATVSNNKQVSGTADIKAGSKLLPIFSAELSGNLTSSSKQDSTTNRSGSLDIELHASEAPMPEGLAKILTLLSNAVTAQNSTSAASNTNNNSVNIADNEGATGTAGPTTTTAATATATTTTTTTGTNP